MCTNLKLLIVLESYMHGLFIKRIREVLVCKEPEGGGTGSLVLCKTATPKSTVPNPQSTEIMSLALCPDQSCVKIIIRFKAISFSTYICDYLTYLEHYGAGQNRK